MVQIRKLLPKQNREITQVEVGRPEYEPEISFLDMCRVRFHFPGLPFVLLRSAKVLLNLFRQPYVLQMPFIWF